MINGEDTGRVKKSQKVLVGNTFSPGVNPRLRGLDRESEVYKTEDCNEDRYNL